MTLKQVLLFAAGFCFVPVTVFLWLLIELYDQAKIAISVICLLLLFTELGMLAVKTWG